MWLGALFMRSVQLRNCDYEYMAGLRYVLDKTWALSTHYDSDIGLGVGVTVTY